MAASSVAGNDAPRYIADCHLGRLAKYLRFMGYDTLFFPHIEDQALVERAREEGRTVLTRDAALARRKHVPVFFLKPTDLAVQLRTLAGAFGLRILDDAHRRCLRCNAPLERVGAAAAGDGVPEKVKSRFDFFQRCPGCERLYWRGDHYRNMLAFLESALNDNGIMRHG